ncbi:MAG TPA: septum formation initiator family protein [Ktedonobacterales bacterium]|nr:septum formation initiator family protein [Ktedonobacterales bacterium]
MSDDRQDFLERQEARSRRMQQRSGQNPLKGKAGAAQPTGQTPKARPAPQAAQRARAKQTRGDQKASSKEPENKALAKDAGDLDDRSLVGGWTGRRGAARREELAGLSPLPPKPKPPLMTRLILWGTVAICGLLILATLGEVWTVHRLNQQIATNQQAADQLQAQNQQLSNSVQQLQQPSTIEQEARKLGFIFPGDQPVVVVTTTPAPAPPQQAAPPSPGWTGFWPDWLKLFFGG